MTLSAPPPVYLVELFSLESGGLDWADVSGDLALSLEDVYWHLFLLDEAVSVNVGEDADGDLEGITFLRPDDSIVAAITAYRLDREVGSIHDHVKALHQAAKISGPGNLQAELTRLF